MTTENNVKEIGMREFSTFKYADSIFRFARIDGRTWWVLEDVCNALELESPDKVAECLKDRERIVAEIRTPGGPLERTLVNMEGLFRVVVLEAENYYASDRSFVWTREGRLWLYLELNWENRRQYHKECENQQTESNEKEDYTVATESGLKKIGLDELVNFKCGRHDLHFAIVGGQPWWLLWDVCMALELESPDKVQECLADSEKTVAEIDTPDGPREMTLVNEEGLHRVVILEAENHWASLRGYYWTRAGRRWLYNKLLAAGREACRNGEQPDAAAASRYTDIEYATRLLSSVGTEIIDAAQKMQRALEETDHNDFFPAVPMNVRIAINEAWRQVDEAHTDLEIVQKEYMRATQEEH